MWFECAPGSSIVNGHVINATPPSADQVTTWFAQYDTDLALRKEVWHRYVLTRGRTNGITAWAKKQFFFRNATPQQLLKLRGSLFA